MELIQLKEVRKNFGTNNLLQSINLTIEEGDIIGIIGKSGSGKTTLLNLISGIIEPSEGEILFYPGPAHGPVNLNQNISKIKKHIGFTPQHNSFYPKLTIKENLLHFASMYEINEETMINNLKNLLQTIKLYDQRNMLAEQLSSGMQKRLDLACSLAHKPRILLLDEPIADLDTLLQQEMLLFLKEVNKLGVTIIIASHDLEALEKVCNKIAIIHKNTLHSKGNIDEVRKPYQKKEFTITLKPNQDKDKIIAALKSMPITKILDKGFSLVIYPSNTNSAVTQLLSFIEKNQLDMNELDFHKLSLKEVFEKVTNL